LSLPAGDHHRTCALIRDDQREGRIALQRVQQMIGSNLVHRVVCASQAQGDVSLADQQPDPDSVGSRQVQAAAAMLLWGTRGFDRDRIAGYWSWRRLGSVRWMLEHGCGRVINVACIYGTRGSINHVGYAAAKGGVIQLTRALALEWARRGVTVNTLGLGWFEGQTQLVLDPDATDQLRRALPALRLGRLSDVETAIIYLASDTSRYLTGETIWLDGGILCR
jgi:NAD(P)-dependent dehydrogenase (short-subunit alcohol dehydrogenase family)